ncbi:MAG: alpha/beta fold hydrolase, partial [Angustibacter sp.]
TTPKGPIVLVGHSMGGMTMMAWAADAPPQIRERVVGVARVATTPRGLAEETWGFAHPIGRIAHRLAPRALSGLTRAPGLVERTRRWGSELEQFLVKRYSYASVVHPSLVKFSAQLIAATPIDVVSAFLPDFDRHDRAKAIESWADVESLVFSGDRDLLTPPEHSAAIAAQLPRAEQVLVPRAGHLVMLEHPDVLNVALADLLLRIELNSAEPSRRRWGRSRRTG